MNLHFEFNIKKIICYISMLYYKHTALCLVCTIWWIITWEKKLPGNTSQDVRGARYITCTNACYLFIIRYLILQGWLV